MRLKELSSTIQGHWQRLAALRDTPHAIAGGIAIGLLIGFTPFLSVKTLLAIGLAALFGFSRVAAAIAVTLHDITLPISPFLIRAEYGIGYWLLSQPHHWPPSIHLQHFHITQWLHWEVLAGLIWPMFLGSMVIGIPVAVVSYLLALPLIARYQARREKPTPG